MRRSGIKWCVHDKPVDRLTHREWVMLRMLYYIISTDTTSVTVKDVLWSKYFIAALVGEKTILKAFDLIRKDQIAEGAYDNPDSRAMRRLRQSINGWAPDS